MSRLCAPHPPYTITAIWSFSLCIALWLLWCKKARSQNSVPLNNIYEANHLQHGRMVRVYWNKNADHFSIFSLNRVPLNGDNIVVKQTAYYPSPSLSSYSLLIIANLLKGRFMVSQPSVTFPIQTGTINLQRWQDIVTTCNCFIHLFDPSSPRQTGLCFSGLKMNINKNSIFFCPHLEDV